MENDETTVETQDAIQEGQTAETEEVVVEEVQEESQSETSEDIPQSKLTYEQKLARATTPEEKFRIADAEASKNRRLLNKKPTVAAPAAQPKVPQTSPTNIEETVLLAQGMDQELIDELKLRAPKYGGSLIKAQTDPRFVAVKEQFEKEKKSQSASLGASRVSGSVKPKVTTRTENLTREQHMELAKGAL